MNKQSILEAILYAAGDEGLDKNQISEVIDITNDELDTLIENYESDSLTIKEFGETIILTTREEVAVYIEKLVENKSNMKLSQAAMETLSIIAYNQPITRSDIELIRGINSDGAVRTLIARGMIEAKEIKDSRSQQLITTNLFLNVFGLKDLDALPTTEEDDEEMEDFFNNLVNQKGDI